MFKTLFLTVLFSLCSLYISAQASAGVRVLPLLGVTDIAVESALQEVSTYISKKPKGLRFPVSKVLFKQIEDGFSYEITGIDNSWANLFNYGKSPYGYVIVANRLFVIMGLSSEDIDLNGIFFSDFESKAFTTVNRPPTGILKNPKWFFEYKNGATIKIKELDLDILER